MERLIEKVENLKDTLNQDEIILDLKKLNVAIKSDPDLVALLTKYHSSPTEELKSEIIKNDIFRKYKERETELNLLILKINQELKQITKKDKCSL